MRRLCAILVIVLVLAAGLAWWQREWLLAWHAVHGLTHAAENERAAWVERLAGHERAALPLLLEALRGEDDRACASVKSGLLDLAKSWPADDWRRIKAGQRLSREFSRLSHHGQLAALELEGVLSEGVAALTPAVAAMALQAADVRDTEIRAQALTLATDLTRQQETSALYACRELTRVCLRDDSPDNRGRALRLAIQPNIDLREEVLPLLSDRTVELRRAAMIVLGPDERILATDALLPWLHDPDPGVRQLCEEALKGRGLRDEHVKMGRLMTDARIGERLKVPDALQHCPDLEPGVWLRLLSHDAAPAVRAATVRVTAEQNLLELLSDRLEQMSQDDPSPTVRQLARYYLSCRKSD
jgi:hypothetical protein